MAPDLASLMAGLKAERSVAGLVVMKDLTDGLLVAETAGS
jgi:hypothetical protein